MSNKQTSINQLIDQVEDFMGLIPVDIINQAQSTHETESIDFALFILSGENFNQFPEAAKQELREKVRKEYNKFFGHPTGRVLLAKMCEAVDKIKLDL